MVHVVAGAVAVHVNDFAVDTDAETLPAERAVAVYEVGVPPVVGAFHDTFACVPLIFTRMSVGLPGLSVEPEEPEVGLATTTFAKYPTAVSPNFGVPSV